MTDDQLLSEVLDLLRFRFAATPAEVAEALGIEIGRAVDLLNRVESGRVTPSKRE